MLTRKQHELLLYVNKRLAEGGVSPSFDEMKIAVGLRSKSGIHRLISGLEERGFIKRLPHRARALEVTRLPDSAAIQYAPDEDDSDMPVPPSNPIAADAVSVPLYGKIAAGTPIEALRDPTSTVEVPAGMVGSTACYALTVDGDSMIDAGILDGDTVVIRQCEAAEAGAVVVALVDDTEVTLKRLTRKGPQIGLEPANAKYETRYFPPNRVRVQGRLVGLLRRY
ncbi:MAG: transcriptional repressor LexA [Alphaproteobacteria bacterium]|nr:transcriptional repressor LexA [Alphaproteobacteria bacterium]